MYVPSNNFFFDVNKFIFSYRKTLKNGRKIKGDEIKAREKWRRETCSINLNGQC